jgi:hypothetical protein
LYARLLGNARVYGIFQRIDEDLAAKARVAGCSCGGRLHSARYPRKARGAPVEIGQEYESRLSFCCAEDGCRRRTTPPSVRFLGRKVYLSAVVVLVSALRQGPSPSRVRVLHELFGVGERTLRRWRQWWQKIFVEGSFWRAAQGRFMPPIAARDLPRALVERFGVRAGEEFVRLLRFLSPITTVSCLLADGGF